MLSVIIKIQCFNISLLKTAVLNVTKTSVRQKQHLKKILQVLPKDIKTRQKMGMTTY